MTETHISQVARIRQGRTIIEFELSTVGLIISYRPKGKARHSQMVLGQEVLEVLRDLLGSTPRVGPMAVVPQVYRPEIKEVETFPNPPPEMTVEDKGDTPRTVPPAGHQTTRTEEGLERHEDGIVSGMEQ